MRTSRLRSVVVIGLLLVSGCTAAGGSQLTKHPLPVVAPSVSTLASGPDPSHPAFARMIYFPNVADDTFYNTVGPTGDIITTSNDSTGVDHSCSRRGSDIAILSLEGASPTALRARTVNCMSSFGMRGGGGARKDGCSWKSAGITRVGSALYLTVARQLLACSRGKEANGIQPSYDASIIKSLDGGRTWTNPWGTTSHEGAAPPWDSTAHRYRAMFPGQSFTPFFIQYGPGNTHTVDGGNHYVYAVSTDGYAYNGNYLRLARVPLTEVQNVKAWQFYHGAVGGNGREWTSSLTGATRILHAEHGVSQPAIQYVPSLKRYVLLTFFFSHARPNFPQKTETPFTELSFYTAPKPWGPWTHVYEHAGQRDLWCTTSPCELTERPGNALLAVGRPSDPLGLYDPSLVQKFVFTRPLTDQAMLICADWKNFARYKGEILNRLHILPVDLTAVLRR